MEEKCPECGVKLKSGAKFCESCGINIENYQKQKEKEIEQQKIQMEEEIKSKLEKEFQEKIKQIENEYVEKIKKEKREIEKKQPLFSEHQYKILIGIIIITIIILIGFFLGKAYRII